MSIYKRGDIYWYKFVWRGELIRETTKQGNDKIARQMESAHRTALAKGEVGIREKKAAPTLTEFLEQDFLPFIDGHFADKPNTRDYYMYATASLLASNLGKCDLMKLRQSMQRRMLRPISNGRPPQSTEIYDVG